MAGAHGESWHEWTSSDPNGPLLAIRPGGCGDVTQAHVLWRDPSGGSDVVSGVVYQDRMFSVSSRGVVACRELTHGGLFWRQRLQGDVFSSLLTGGGLAYTTSEQGRVDVIESADEFRLATTNVLGDRSMVSPAVGGGDIFVRSTEYLIRIAMAVPGGQPEGVIALAE